MFLLENPGWTEPGAVAYGFTEFDRIEVYLADIGKGKNISSKN